MLKYLPFFLICIVAVSCQNWGTRACLVNRNGYFVKIIQEVVSRIEKNIKWCNFKLNDVNLQIDERLFKWHAQGTVNYTNGFLLNLQSIDVTNIISSFSNKTENETMQYFVSVNGILNFRNLYVGYDVVANIEGFDTQYYTGVFPYTLFAIRCTVGMTSYNLKNISTNITCTLLDDRASCKPVMLIINLRTKEATAIMQVVSSTAAVRRMTYMPQNRIAELLSRHFASYHVSLNQWGNDYIAPLIVEVASETELPEIRYDNRC